MSQQLLERFNQPIFTYPNFSKWMNELAKGTDPYQIGYSDHLMSFMKINLARMDRLDRAELLNEAQLDSIDSSLPVSAMEWIVITEPWCGDSAQSLPIIHKLSEALNIPLCIVLRDRNPELIEKYHTDGNHAIPKLVALDSSKEDVFVWGPRPAGAQSIVLAWKTDPKTTKKELETSIHTWYARDKSKSIQHEILQLFERSSPAGSNIYDAIPIR